MKKQKALDNQGKKIKRNDENSYEIFYDILENRQYISDNKLKELLSLKNSLKNRLVQDDFLEKYELFTLSQLSLVKDFILSRINDNDCIFVSSLIECANFNNILSIYDICINFISRKRNFAVVAASINYVFEHFNFHNINEIVAAFKKVTVNNRYYYNCKVLAGFYLFRITMDFNYYNYLKKIIIEGGDICHQVLFNLLHGMEYNNENYFVYHKQIENLLNNGSTTDLNGCLNSDQQLK